MVARFAALVGALVALTLAGTTAAVAAPVVPAAPGNPPMDVKHDRCSATTAGGKAHHTCLHRDKTGGLPKLTARAKALRAEALHGTDSVQPDIAVPPSQCNFGSFYGANQPDRFTSCTDWYWTLYTWEEIDGTVEITGWLDFEDIQYVQDVQGGAAPDWTHGLNLVVYDGWGLLEAGTEVAIESGCELDPTVCESGTRLPGGDAGGTAFDAIPFTTWSSEWDELDNGNVVTIANSTDWLDGQLGVQISGEGPFNPWTLQDYGEGLLARCDNIETGSGCVNEDFVPTLTYSAITNPLVAPVAQHIYDAQNGGLATAWGVPPNVLERDMNAADQAANNRVACSGVTLPTGTNCDEFPMASTYQGAAFNSDYSIAIVPQEANSSQGGITGGFYRSNRILDGIDPFYVLAILANGTPSW